MLEQLDQVKKVTEILKEALERAKQQGISGEAIALALEIQFVSSVDDAFDVGPDAAREALREMAENIDRLAYMLDDDFKGFGPGG